MNRPLLLALFAATAVFAQRIPTDAIEEHRDQPYAGTDNPKQKLDFYLPKKRANDKPLPVVVFIHGGGWRHGDRAGGVGKIAPFVASGEYAGVSVGYRLTDETIFPAQIFDCKAAIRWIRGHAKEYNLDPDHIGVWGTSAGGHLVSLLGTSGDVKELEGDLGPNNKESSRVQCVVNFFGPENFATMLKEKSSASPGVRDLLGGLPEEKPDAARAASPITYVSADDPPFLNAHGSKDPTVPFGQAVEIDTALKKVGVPSIIISVTDAGHGFRSRAVDERVKQFFAMHLRGVKSEIDSSAVPDETPKEKPKPKK
jgi:acetyl esterase/lipase